MLTTEWNLAEGDITCVMQRLDVTYDQGADVSMIRGIAEELMDERREHVISAFPPVHCKK